MHDLGRMLGRSLARWLSRCALFGIVFALFRWFDVESNAAAIIAVVFVLIAFDGVDSETGTERFHKRVLGDMEAIMKTLQDLIDQGNATLAQIKKNTDLDDSIIGIVNANAALIVDLRAQLQAAGTDPAKLAELADVMQKLSDNAVAEGQKTADAVTAGTNAG